MGEELQEIKKEVVRESERSSIGRVISNAGIRWRDGLKEEVLAQLD